MRLTPLAKAFIAIVVVAVIGFATWHYKGDAIKQWVGGEKETSADSKDDFDKLKGAPDDPARNIGSTGVSSVTLGTRRRHQHVGRPRTRHRLQQRHGPERWL
jgi:hypothetical protein